MSNSGASYQHEAGRLDEELSRWKRGELSPQLGSPPTGRTSGHNPVRLLRPVAPPQIEAAEDEGDTGAFDRTDSLLDYLERRDQRMFDLLEKVMLRSLGEDGAAERVRALEERLDELADLTLRMAGGGRAELRDARGPAGRPQKISDRRR